MLSEHERSEIDVQVAQYAYPRAAAADALRVVQRSRGWVDDEALQDIAQHLGMSPHDLDSVATFYNLVFRKPVGRHVILVCDSISCYVMGYETVRDYLSRRLGIGLGETTPDSRFTLLPIVCLGACDHAPVMMVDRDLHGDLDGEKIDAILARYE
jgi:NADH-quinone oxidoreductase subunit E